MAINVGAAFKRTSANPIDESMVLSKAEMLAVDDNLMPVKYLAVCKDDGKLYTYDKNATPSAETGKFSEAGGSIDVDTEMSDTSENAVQNKVIKAYVDTEVAKKGNAKITFDNEYQYLQIRDDNGTDIGFSQETANTVRVQEYAKDDRGQVQKIFDETLASKTYVDDALDEKADFSITET